MDHATAAADQRFVPTEFRMTRTCRLLVRGKNFNPDTMLSTDYLNHFNEIVMLIEMVPAMPECMDDVRAWRPKTYAEHFRDSSFADRELAILAYDNAPDQHRIPFEHTVQRLNNAVTSAVQAIECALAACEPGLVDRVAQDAAAHLRALIDVAGSIIHGQIDVVDQTQIDALLIDPPASVAGDPVV